jgi:hypothetical protein
VCSSDLIEGGRLDPADRKRLPGPPVVSQLFTVLSFLGIVLSPSSDERSSLLKTGPRYDPAG